MFLASLFTYLIGNGIYYHNKNVKANKKMAEMNARGAGVYINGKKYPLG